MTATSNPFELPAGIKAKGAGRSMFGSQVDSRKTSLPTYSFSNSSNRDQASKMFLSQAHTNADHKGLAFNGDSYDYSSIDKQVTSNHLSAPSAGFSHAPRLTSRVNDVPGPGQYPAASSIGDQPCSPNLSPPKYRFSGTTRDESSKVFMSAAHQSERKGMQGPPPGTYDHLGGAVGSQALSNKRNSASFSMAKAERLKDKTDQLAQTQPAVGTYETWASIGKQSQSQFRTLPSYKFPGSSGWENEGKRFLTSAHAESLKGTLSPANFDSQTDANMTSFGRQSLSNKLSTPSPKFSHSERFPVSKIVKDSPGPGKYE